jgi:uncharacterized protein YbaR (Trm112 family)
MISAELLEIMACPACLSPVMEADNKIVCQGTQCGLKFPIREGIPVMLVTEAEGPPELRDKLAADPMALRPKN